LPHRQAEVACRNRQHQDIQPKNADGPRSSVKCRFIVDHSVSAVARAAKGESMDSRKRLKAVVVLLLGVAGFGATMVEPAHSATLYTPTMAANTAGLYCEATNVSSKPQTITVELKYYPDGSTRDSATAIVPPGNTIQAADNNIPGFCKITTQGSKSTVRGVIWVLSGFNTVAAAPAQ
jgi:hypothetical protein